CCAAAPSTSSAATHQKAPSPSNSSVLAGTMNFYATFSVRWRRHEPNAIALKRREAAGLVSGIANGFARAVENLSHQKSLSRALVEDGTSGRTFIQAASKETKSQFLIVMPEQ